MENKQDWTKIIRSEESFFKLNLKEILEYKDLIFNPWKDGGCEPQYKHIAN